MAFIRERKVSANGLDMFIAEAGETGQPLVLCLHGFPECWASWRYQLPMLAQSGYYAVAPDLRGYGETGGSGQVDGYRMSILVEDVHALVQALGYERAILVGHDWGCALSWQVARQYPQAVEAVVGMSVPYGGPAPEAPTDAMKRLFEDRFFYMLYFQQPALPEQELEKDVRDSLRKIFHSLSADGIAEYRVGKNDSGLLDSMSAPDQPPRWMREEDLDYYTERYQRSGFTGPVNWYRAMDLSWEQQRADGRERIHPPAFFLAGKEDPVIQFAGRALKRMPELMDDLAEPVMLDDIGHWVQMEAADTVNEHLGRFLRQVDDAG